MSRLRWTADREMTLILSTWGYQTNPGFDYVMQTSGGMGQMMMGSTCGQRSAVPLIFWRTIQGTGSSLPQFAAYAGWTSYRRGIC